MNCVSFCRFVPIAVFEAFCRFLNESSVSHCPMGCVGFIWFQPLTLYVVLTVYFIVYPLVSFACCVDTPMVSTI